ncbi:type I secretion C-terminal target domain (VC_A0849 subclass) [Pustulibacterium marinum]|uniref:Type I secretion C-terminal target domain (VC_A0849 subclass) n=1 Tax=Pustulibacterium marinum TaxID=1224947 RepID=A0A1I7EU14_9FLAO|nr:tetratricopeptide repeat protein [Pustulibacterium marinum]SFU27372.1 type I secretion C-terminal target domain (VC_A0849 subclass) [Pustulibacterium marinum]
MKNKHYILVAIALAFITLVGCSRKKDKFLNRNVHALNTKYNILYNGNLALEDGKEQLATTYQDNYWDILPVERMQEKDVVMLPGSQKNSNFERAEEKATKAIQKHSMNIGGREKNSQIDEAFLLLGKARYYEERMIPALEAFNYIIKKYPKSSGIVQAKVWREKVNMRLDNNELALLNLKKIFKKNYVDEENHADVRATMAEAYINLKIYDSAATALSMAADLTKNNVDKGRYLYILGQLYNELGNPVKANKAFDRVIELNRKSPRIYMIHAYIEKIKNFDKRYGGSKYENLELLNDLAKNRENRPYLDIIYHELGNFHLDNDSIRLAALFYNKSLQQKSIDRYLNALNYSELGEMNFNIRDYKTAGKYYDSTLVNLNENTKMFRLFQKKKNNLEDVIYYEDITQRNDSILSLVAMSSQEREAYFNDIIKNIEADRKAAKEEAEKQALIAAQSQGGGLSSKGASSGNSFYFYSDVTLQYGKNEFKRKWGDRALEDDWRISSTKTLSKEEMEEVAKEGEEAATKDDLVSLDYYLGTVPTDHKIIDSVYSELNYAYYQLGLIYFAKFKEYDLAADRLETLLNGKPDENLIIPAKYNLYKIYLNLNPAEAEKLKQHIINTYPDSRYAMILKNPQADLAADENGPDATVSFYVEAMKNDEYNLVLEYIDVDIARFTGDPVVPKLEMTKAIAIGRLKGLKDYKDALSFVALNYPASDEGKRAQTLLSGAIKTLERQKFNMALKEGDEIKLVFPYTSENIATVQEFKNEYKLKSKDIPELKKFTTSVDLYSNTKNFFVFHGFESKKELEAFFSFLNEKLKIEIPQNRFFITSDNYAILQIHKNLEEYSQPSIP